METTLAVLMVLGIFVGIPAIIGFAIAGVYIMGNRRARRAERAQSVAEAIAAAEDMVAEAKGEQPAKAGGQQKNSNTTTVT
jgi:flagellar biosynthesis component FlhA